MSGDSRQSQLADWIRPPRAGEASSFATSTVAATQDLRAIGNQAPSAAVPNRQTRGLTGHYIRIWAVTVDVYVMFGSTSALVGSIAPATNGANGANVCVPITAGTYQDFLIADDTTAPGAAAQGPDTWLGYVTLAGTGQIKIAQVSP